MQHVGNGVLELVITITWSIWFNRNKVKHDKPHQSAAMNIHKARPLIEEFQVANFQLLKPAEKEENKWINPKPPLYKINSNGAVFQQEVSGVGAVIRDHAGRVIAALSKKLQYPLFGGPFFGAQPCVVC